MLNRLIEINRCVDCPHHAMSWVCNKTGMKTSCASGEPIPCWCPLPEAKQSVPTVNALNK